jgi:hypothetical protein
MNMGMTWKVRRILSKNRAAGKTKKQLRKNESCPSFIHFGIHFWQLFVNLVWHLQSQVLLSFMGGLEICNKLLYKKQSS